MNLSLATTADIPEIAQLEKCFVFPLSESELYKLLENELFRIVIWKDAETILGHCVLYRICDEAEITSFAVREAERKKGIGTAFLKELLTYLKEDEAKIAYLEVRESNIAARRVYSKCGFSEIGLRKRFYQKPVEDAIVMGIEL